LLFASISGLAFMLPTNRQILFMISANLLLLSLFMAPLARKLPTNYNSQPAILTYWQIEMLLTTFQLIICGFR
ncbi:hypothetical protein PMAYCL1PPCAC_25371, partial [Pristionchus mayeri]